jgi:4-amino-4-deoxy-L-arabinose transferase-like glycosyltransferase
VVYVVFSQDSSPQKNFFYLTPRDAVCLVSILLLFIIFGLLYSYYTPLWSPPDEERHFAYCEYIAQNHKLPHLIFEEEERNIAQAIHPPLFYLLASLLCKNDGKLIQETVLVNDGPGFNTITHPANESTFPFLAKAREAHLIRLFSLLLSTASVCFVYLLVLVIFPGETALAVAATLFVAMNPQFLHISASVSNEPFSTLLSTTYLLALLNYITRKVTLKHHLMVGLLLGFCLLSKLSLVFYLPLTVAILVYVHRGNTRTLLHSLVCTLGSAGLVAGWWYLRNWLVFKDPLLTKFLIDSQPWGLRSGSFSLDYALTTLSNTFLSFFGNFGAHQIPIGKIHLLIYAIITMLGVLGWFRIGKIKKPTGFQIQVFSIVFLSLCGCIIFFILMNMKYIGVSMGRYLFVVIAPITLVLFTGLRLLVPPRWRSLALIVLSFLLIITNLDILFRIVKPAYCKTSLVAGADQPEFSRPTVAINSSTTISQSFSSPRNNLSSIRVMFSNPNKLNSGEIIFSLKEAQDKDRVLRQISFPLEKISDNTRYLFVFPPIENSMDKKYLFSFSSPAQPDGEGVSLWYESRDCYPQGKMFVNGEPVAGDLYYTAFYFTGEYPQTDWQGTKETVINQGLYVGTRELQLYNERSKEFREKTVTHQKIIRFKKAHHNRKTMNNTNNHA